MASFVMTFVSESKMDASKQYLAQNVKLKCKVCIKEIYRKNYRLIFVKTLLVDKLKNYSGGSEVFHRMLDTKNNFLHELQLLRF